MQGFDRLVLDKDKLIYNFFIKYIFIQADRELGSSGKPPEKLKAAGSFLMKVFGVLVVCLSLHTLLLIMHNLEFLLTLKLIKAKK